MQLQLTECFPMLCLDQHGCGVRRNERVSVWKTSVSKFGHNERLIIDCSRQDCTYGIILGHVILTGFFRLLSPLVPIMNLTASQQTLSGQGKEPQVEPTSDLALGRERLGTFHNSMLRAECGIETPKSRRSLPTVHFLLVCPIPQ